MNTDWGYHTAPLWERPCSRRGHLRHHRIMSSTFKRWRLKDTSRHALWATPPCAIAYSYARIRRLVRLGGGFAVTADFKNEELLADACETLASARTIANDFAHLIPASQRRTLLGIAQLIMLGELAVNRALDNLELAG